MVAFRDRLAREQQAKRSCVVVGLDPRVDQLPASFRAYEPPDALFAFNQAVIDAVSDICVAIKPQSAFYERYGPPGFEALRQTIAYARERGLLSILDCKRGDIGPTVEAYAHAFLHPDGPFNADAVTVNAYMGSDAVQPFMDLAARYGKAVFVLVKTSNPSSSEIQDLPTAQGPIFEVMARLVDQWDCEAVVGGTWPEQAARARSLMPRATILVPGYGSQGATAQDVLPSFRADGSGAIVNNARGIIQADPWPQGPRRAAEAMRDAINTALADRNRERVSHPSQPKTDKHALSPD